MNIEINDLEFVRGDTFFISRYLTDEEGNKLILNPETDELTFTLRTNIYSEILIEKKLKDMKITEDGKYTVTLNPRDTEELDFKKYNYDFEVRIGKDEDDPFVRTPETGTITLQEYDYSRPNKRA